MIQTKLNNLSEIAYLPEGLYLLPEGYNSRVLSALQYALRYCHMRRQIWTEDDSYIRIVPPNPKSQESEPMEFKLTRHKLYQYLLVLDFVNDLMQGQKAVIIKPLREGFELSPGFLNEAKYICNVIQGFNPRFKEHPDGSLIMSDKGNEDPLTKRVFYAMKEASDNGRAVVLGISEKIMTVSNYVSSYRRSIPGISAYVDGSDVVFEKKANDSNDADSYFEKFQGIFNETEPFKAIPVSIESIPVSNNYFRTRIKAMCEPGMDVLVTIQMGMKRALVTKLPFEWQCAMSAENDAVDPQWDDDDDEWNAPVVAVDDDEAYDDEAYEDDPAETDFETENDEML